MEKKVKNTFTTILQHCYSPFEGIVISLIIALEVETVSFDFKVVVVVVVVGGFLFFLLRFWGRIIAEGFTFFLIFFGLASWYSL